MTRGYALKITAGDNGMLRVTAPDFPEVETVGEDVDEARANGRAAIETAIMARMARGAEIPEPTDQDEALGWSADISDEAFEDMLRGA